jgi:hypothetical protein
MRGLIVAVGGLAVVASGCIHRSARALRIGQEVSPPQGLDSLGTATWIAHQRAACPGNLRFLVDQMPFVSLDGSPVPYHSGIVAVECVRLQARASRPSA